MIIREKYLKELDAFREKEVIKVVTGIRRCGKSSVLTQYCERLLASGVLPEQIISINFEDLQYENLLSYRAMYDYVTERLYDKGYTYIFLDELQKVTDFQKAVDSLLLKPNVDIYITGSNADLLSSELATLLTGRYVEIKMTPLSFAEYASAKTGDADKLFYEYLANGSLPYALGLDSKAVRNEYVNGVFQTIMMVDVMKRHPETDFTLLESILRFLLHNVGNLVSSTAITNTLGSVGRKTSYNTVEKYIGFLKECYIIYEAQRFDVKGKQHLKSLAKYYVVDNGFRNLLLANEGSDLGHVLENVVYLELLRRYGKVSVGKLDDKEVDFVVQHDNGLEYFQVASSVMDGDKLQAELLPLKKIKDNYPKYLLTLDRYDFGNFSGIKVLNAVDFLLK